MDLTAAPAGDHALENGSGIFTISVKFNEL